MKLRTKEALRTIRTKESALNEREYAGNRLQGTEQKMIRTAVGGADRIGKWGVRQTKKTISRYRKHRMAKKAEKGKKVTEKAAKTAVKGTKVTARFTKRATQATVKTVQAAVKATVAAIKGIAAGTKLTAAILAAGGWVAVLIILLICAVILVAGTIEDFLPFS